MSGEACPFCGSESVVVVTVGDRGRGRAVYCDDCGAQGPRAAEASDAIEMWNKVSRKVWGDG